MTSGCGEIDRTLHRAATVKVQPLHRLGIRERDTSLTCWVEIQTKKNTCDGSFVPPGDRMKSRV